MKNNFLWAQFLLLTVFDNFHFQNNLFSRMMLNLWEHTTIHQFTKYNTFLLEYWFLAKNLSKFVSLPWKLVNPSYHSLQQWFLFGVSARWVSRVCEKCLHPFMRMQKLSWFAQKLWLCIWFHCCKLGMNLSHPKFESSSVPHQSHYT